MKDNRFSSTCSEHGPDRFSGICGVCGSPPAGDVNAYRSGLTGPTAYPSRALPHRYPDGHTVERSTHKGKVNVRLGLDDDRDAHEIPPRVRYLTTCATGALVQEYNERASRVDRGLDGLKAYAFPASLFHDSVETCYVQRELDRRGVLA